MKLVGKGFYGDVYFIPEISGESFIHFTGLEPAVQILRSKKLLMNPPHQKFGGDAIYGISTRYGKWVPGTQTSHIKFPNMVGVLFRTNVIPKVGYPEEVVWERDISLTQAKILPFNTAKSLVQRAPFKGEGDFEVYYGKIPAWIKRARENLIEKAIRIAYQNPDKRRRILGTLVLPGPSSKIL